MKSDDEKIIKGFLESDLGSEDMDSSLIAKIMEESGKFETDSVKDLSKDFNQIQAGIKKQSIKRNLSIFWRVAAVIVIAFGLTWFFLPKSQMLEIASNKGEIIDVVLPDGSKVVLGPESQIKYNNKKWQENRTVELFGKAYFDVNKGSKFSVRSNERFVEVLGTSFTVESRNSNFRVQCYTGKVGVSLNSASTVLTPGQEVFLDKNKLIEEEIEIDKHQVWISGSLFIDNLELVKLTPIFERSFGVQVLFKTKTSRSFTGYIYINESIESNLDRICKVMGLSYQKKNQGYIITEIE